MTRVFLAPTRQPTMQLPHSVQPVRAGPAPPKNGSATSDTGLLPLLPGLRVGPAEEDPDRRLAEGVPDAHLVGDGPHDLLDRALARVVDDAEHPRGLVVVRRQLAGPVGDRPATAGRRRTPSAARRACWRSSASRRRPRPRPAARRRAAGGSAARRSSRAAAPRSSAARPTTSWRTHRPRTDDRTRKPLRHNPFRPVVARPPSRRNRSRRRRHRRRTRPVGQAPAVVTAARALHRLERRR